MKQTYPSEHLIQSAFFQWCGAMERQHPALAFWFAIPNGASKSMASAMKFRREGLKSGVPDCHLPIAAGEYHGLWIEFKSKRGVVSDVQKVWIEALRNAGHRVEICRDWETAVEITKEYLAI